jgi:hypothetical protein
MKVIRRIITWGVTPSSVAGSTTSVVPPRPPWWSMLHRDLQTSDALPVWRPPWWAPYLLDPCDDRCTVEISRWVTHCQSGDPAMSNVPSRSLNDWRSACPMTPATSDAPSSSPDEPCAIEGHCYASSSVVLMWIHRYVGLAKPNVEEFLPRAMRYLPWPFFAPHVILVGS